MPPPENQNTIERLLADAIAHHQAGRVPQAEQLYRDILKVDANHLSALYRLGILYFQNNKAKQALPFLEAALKQQPQNPNILSSLGVASHMAGLDPKAVIYLRQALAIKPNDAGILGNLGKVLREQGDSEAALDCFKAADQASPDQPSLSIEIGRCHYEAEHFQEALLYFEKALKNNPDYVDALSACSSALLALGRRAEARVKLERAVHSAPNDAKIILNFGEFLAFDEGKIDEALDCFNRALAIVPTFPNALWRKSFALLAKGEYREGWKLYVDCLGNRDTRGVNRFEPKPPWDGAPDPTKHLVIWCEQGFGDALHFIRYAALCKQRVGKVTVFCQKPLVRFFKNLPYIDDASDQCAHDSFDEHVPVMSLPHIFDTTLETIPSGPYLSVDPVLQAKWAAKFDTVTDIKVGLVWAGGAHEDNIVAKLTDRQRSVTLEQMRLWLGIQDIKFYSLQKDKPAQQIKETGLADHITDYMGEVTDFADTAALIQNLDLVITVDTAVAHLAGGLGKPVWILSRRNTDWRWLQNRPENPWYPSARIFGQPEVGDWASVINQIGHELATQVEKLKHS